MPASFRTFKAAVGFLRRPLFKTKREPILRQGPGEVLVTLLVVATLAPLLLARDVHHGVLWLATSIVALSSVVSIALLVSKRFRDVVLDSDCTETRWRRFARVQLVFIGISALLLLIAYLPIFE